MSLDLVSTWLSDALNPHYGAVRAVASRGAYARCPASTTTTSSSSDLSAEARWCVGWINHDRTTFSSKKLKDGNIGEVRLMKLLEPKTNVVEIDMSAAQHAKYDPYVQEIE